MIQGSKLFISPTASQVQMIENILSAENEYWEVLKQEYVNELTLTTIDRAKKYFSWAATVDMDFLEGIYLWYKNWIDRKTFHRQLKTDKLKIYNFRVPLNKILFNEDNIVISGLGSFHISSPILNENKYEIDYLRVTKSQKGGYYFRIIYKGVSDEKEY